jgi:alpha-D-xyloside xylohydrolase
MKFTEGYWLRSERANAVYASQAYRVTAIPGGMRVLAPCRPITNRKDELDLSTLTLEFTSPADGVIAVRVWHYEALLNPEARFEMTAAPGKVDVTITDEEAVMTAGELSVRVNRKVWGYQFEAGGKVLSTCGFRNLGYSRWDKQPASLFPGPDYLTETCTPYLVNELSLAPGEQVYGLGERFTAFAKNGQVVETWNEDGGTASQVSYKSIPFYMTSGGYGVLVDHAGHVSFEVASEKVEYVGFSVQGEELRYLFFYGPKPAQVLERYTALTGRPALPPAWSFGLWLTTSFTTNYDEKTTMSFIQGMRDRSIPLSVFHFDCFWMKSFQWSDFEWNQDDFPDPRGMLKRYHDLGLKICVWINPYVAQGTPFFSEGVQKGYFLLRADGRGVKQIDNWQPGMALVDFSNPAACAWYVSKLEALMDMGVDSFKTDFGERIPVDVTYHSGEEPRSMHNFYTYLYTRCVFEAIDKKQGKGKALVFARSATTGSQKFPVHWGGDSSASFASMAETLRGGLSLAMSGFAFWSHDIAGFEQTATADLYKRWVAFGMLSSHSRLHGSTSYRVPWLFDDEATEVLRHFVHLKHSLMPYLFRTALLATETGAPMVRPMAFDFPDDPGVKTLDLQYMLGDSLLVAPIFNAEGAVDCYLPEGGWFDYFTGQPQAAGRWHRSVHDYFSLPLSVKAGSLLAVGARVDRPDYDYADGVELRLYGLVDGGDAVCAVPSVEGATVLTVKASRRGRSLKLAFSQPCRGLVVLYGFPATARVEGAELVPGDRVVLKPLDKEVVVTLA